MLGQPQTGNNVSQVIRKESKGPLLKFSAYALAGWTAFGIETFDF